MLTKNIQRRLPAAFTQLSREFGSGGAYNPNRFKTYFVPRELPEDQEIFEMTKNFYEMPAPPQRNMRHINPVRESGPLPPYDGPHTMEDIRRIYNNTCITKSKHPVSTDIDEIMRRVPGITRKEAEHITTLGLNPDEEVDFAYIAYNIGLDVFYPANQVYIARQVVTNSKGERVEVFMNATAFEDFSMVSCGFAPVMENVDYHWEFILWGDSPIHPLCDFDLCAPMTWFEYECEWNGEMNMIEDQFSLPEDVRQFPSPKHPNASAELYRSQEKMQEIQDMEDPEWYPRGTSFNIYNKPDYKVTSL